MENTLAVARRQGQQGEWREVGVAKGQYRRDSCGVGTIFILIVWPSVYWLWYCSIILQDVTFGETGSEVHWLSLCYFSQWHVNWQLSQKYNFKKQIKSNKNNPWILGLQTYFHASLKFLKNFLLLSVMSFYNKETMFCIPLTPILLQLMMSIH